MTVQDLLISTGVDNLIRLVHDAGRIEIKDAAKHLGLSTASVEEWSRVLEEEGIIRIEYQLTKIFLVWVGSSPKELAHKAEQLSDKKAELSRDIETMIGRLEARGEELDRLDRDFRKLSDLLDPKLGVVKRKLEALKEIEDQKDKLFDSHIEKMNKAREEYRKLNETLSKDERRASEMWGKVKEVHKEIGQVEPDIENLLPMKNKISELVERLSHEAKEISDALAVHKEQLQNLDMIARDLKERRSVLTKMEERIADVGGEIKDLIETLDMVSQEAKKQQQMQESLESVKLKIKEFEQQKNFLQNLHESVNKESKEVLQKAGSVLRVIDEMDSKFKDVKKLESSKLTPMEEYLSKMKEIKQKSREDLKELGSLDSKAMADIAKAKTELEKQLSEMRDFTKAFEGMAQKKRQVDEISAKIEDMQNERRKLFQQLTLISKEIELINIQATQPGSPKKDLKVGELMKKIEVVRRDQAEFDKRRTELRGMIEKIIDTERSKKDGEG